MLCDALQHAANRQQILYCIVQYLLGNGVHVQRARLTVYGIEVAFWNRRGFRSSVRRDRDNAANIFQKESTADFMIQPYIESRQLRL
jgi:hypothetical protein